MLDGHPLAQDLSLTVIAPSAPAGFSDGPQRPWQRIGCTIAGRLSGHAWEQLELPFLIQGGLLSLANTGPLAVKHQVLCIHDVNTWAFPSSYSRSFRLLYGTLLPLLGRRVARVTTVSQYSRLALQELGVVPQKRIDLAPDGYEHALAWTPRHDAVSKASAGPRTVVVLGSPAPHKNVRMLLKLAPQLGEHGIQIAVVGQRDSRVFRQSDDEVDAENVRWLGRLPDDALAALLRDSMCLAFPSFVEGFGIPALEAMALGTAVIASDRASLPEIGGDAALFADPEDPSAWLDAILRLAKEPGLRESLIARGHEQVKKFSWARTAEVYLEIFKEIDGSR